MMKSVLLVVLLAASATATVVSNEVPDVAGEDDVADVEVNKMPEVVVTDVDELVDMADLTDMAGETAVAPQCDLSQGSIGPSDVRLYNAEYKANGVAGHVHLKEKTIRTNRQITAIRVTCIGDSQNATPSIVSGGVGYNFITIRMQSATNHGFHYSVQVYGK